MRGQFREDGVSFSYPENWSLEREETDNGWTISVHSPDTAFFTLSLDTERPEPEYMAEQALEAMREEYPDLEADEARETVGGQPAVGHDLWFFSLDLTNTCWTRAFPGREGTFLLLCQVSDVDAQLEPILRAICASLRVE